MLKGVKSVDQTYWSVKKVLSFTKYINRVENRLLNAAASINNEI